MGCDVDTITLSVQQMQVVRERAKSFGVGDRVRVHLLDYRNLPKEWEGTFDRFVSIEMMEHVGREFYEGYLGVVDRMLKKKDAIGVVHVITNPEASEFPYPPRQRMFKFSPFRYPSEGFLALQDSTGTRAIWISLKNM